MEFHRTQELCVLIAAIQKPKIQELHSKKKSNGGFKLLYNLAFSSAKTLTPADPGCNSLRMRNSGQISIFISGMGCSLPLRDSC